MELFAVKGLNYIQCVECDCIIATLKIQGNLKL